MFEEVTSLPATDPVRIAQEIHERYKLSIPIRPERLAGQMGITVVGLRLSERLSGLLTRDTYDPSRYLIVVNIRHMPTRRRFTIAHEIGHYCLHRSIKPTFCDRLDGVHRLNRLEREADQFAAELLMPEIIVMTMAAMDYTFEDMLQVLSVSRPALERRIRELGIKVKKGAIA